MIWALVLFLGFTLKNADCLILKDSTVVTLDSKDKRQTYRFLKVKILNERGRDNCGDIKVRYDKGSAVFKILKAYTLLPEGKKVDVEKDAIMDVGAPEAAIAPQYTNVVMRAVSFPALSRDAEIVYEYKISSKKKTRAPLFGSVLFQDKDPCIKKTLIINVPSRMKIFYKLYGDSIIRAQIDTQKEKIRYVFRADSINKVPEEGFIPPLIDFVPRVDYTSLKNADEMAKWLSEKFEKSIEVTDNIKRLAQSLRMDDDITTFYRVLEYVQEKIQNINLYLWDAGFVPHKASWVLKHKYGDVRDKTVLCVSLLKALGIKAEPILVMTPKGEYSTSVGLSSVLSMPQTVLPVPSLYTSMLVMASLKDTVFLASSMERYGDIDYLPSVYQGKRAMAFMRGVYREVEIPVFKENKSTLNIKLEGTVNEKGGFSGVWSFQGTGIYSGRLRSILRFKKRKELDVMFQQLVKSFGQSAKVSSFKLRNIDKRTASPMLILYITSEDFAASSDNMLQFTLPLVSIITRYATRKERKLPLYVGELRKVKYTASFNIPDGFKPFILPDSLTTGGKYNCISIDAHLRGKTLDYNAEYVISSFEVPACGYTKYRKVEGLFFSKNKRSVILNR